MTERDSIVEEVFGEINRKIKEANIPKPPIQHIKQEMEFSKKLMIFVSVIFATTWCVAVFSWIASGELILFFIIVAVVAVLKGRKAEKQHEREREKHILEVIKENTVALVGVRVVLENNGITAKEAFGRVHSRIDAQANTLVTISNEVAQINTKFDTSFENQKEIASKVNKILMIVDKIPNDKPRGDV